MTMLACQYGLNMNAKRRPVENTNRRNRLFSKIYLLDLEFVHDLVDPEPFQTGKRLIKAGEFALTQATNLLN